MTSKHYRTFGYDLIKAIAIYLMVFYHVSIKPMIVVA